VDTHGDLRAQRKALAHVIKNIEKRKGFNYMSLDNRLNYYALCSLLADIDAEIITKELNLLKKKILK
jgi:hypothetical protein